MSIATHYTGCPHTVPDSARLPSRPWSPPGVAVHVAVPALPAAAQSRLVELALQHDRRLSFGPFADPAVDETWRLESAAGGVLSDRQIRARWHRAPYRLPLRLMRYHTGSDVLLGTAVLGTRGSLKDYLDHVARTTERLIGDAISGTNRGDPGSSGDDTSAGQGILPGRINRSLAVWHSRLFAEWWSVGHTTVPLPQIIGTREVGPVHWIAPKRGTAYLADPFPWPGQNRILCEEMPLTGEPGRIVARACEIEPERSGSDVVLDDGAHHSYPCTFAEHDSVYLLPEATERGATTLYRLLPPRQLTPVCTVAPGRRLADPTLFRHGDSYWIACTDLDVGEHDNLCLFHADDVCGPWQAHRCHPVKVDISGARPAGTPFVLNGQLFRPGQDCAQGYGAGVTVHRVDVLTAERFHETAVARLKPDPAGPFPDGLHTFAVDQNRIWVDGKRHVFDPAGAWRKLMRRAGLRMEQAGGKR